MERKIYLTNANLLKEMHRSKLTYCCYQEEKYAWEDIICENYELITPYIINQFFENNPNRDYIIIRVMTAEHIPNYNDGRKLNLQELKMTPFKHFLLSKDDFIKVFNKTDENNIIELLDKYSDDIENFKEEIKENNKRIRFNKLNKDKQVPYKQANELLKNKIESLTEQIKQLSTSFTNNIKPYLKEVLRSHWHGDTIETGHYTIDYGKLTDEFVRMIMLLVDQYARSGNWSGYTYIDDFKSSALVHLCDVALKFEEIKSSNVFSYLTQVTSMKFTANLNAEKTQSRIKSQLMQDIGYDSTYSEILDNEYKDSYFEDKLSTSSSVQNDNVVV